MAKEISFSEFLKEGTFKKEEVLAVEKPLEEKPIRIEPDMPADDKELKKFWKEVRHFFRTAERPKGPNGMLIPALLAPYLKAGNYTNAYPVFISENGSECRSLVTIIQETFDGLFKENEAKILRKNLPRILKDFRAEAKREKHFVSYKKAWAVAEEDLLSVDVRGDRKKEYVANIEKLKTALPQEGYVLRFTDEAAFMMMHIQLKEKESQRAIFFEEIKKQVSALEEYLEVEENRVPEKEVAKNEKGYAFADDMISFEKVGKLMPKQGSEGLTAERVARIKNVVATLKTGLVDWQKYSANIIITEALVKSFAWKEIFPHANIIEAGVNEGYSTINATFDPTVKAYAQFIAAQRIATLELKDDFVDDVHIDFYDNFTWHRLTSEEMQHFPQVIFIGETQGFLKHNLERFSKLLSLNKPIRLLALEKRLVNAPNPDVNWEDASHGYRQELAAIAIAHRSTHTFQCALNQPLDVYSGMKKCLEVDAPSIMHFLIPDTDEIKLAEVLKLTSAVEGRFFPSITYDLSKGNKWGSRFDISANPHPESNWPVYDFDFFDIDGEKKTQQLTFTYADYKATSKEKVEELMMIPESFKSDDLIHIVDFLNTPVEKLTGKVPFIWLVNQDNCLKRAALPYMWVVSCQERLDNWNYIQELGGVNSYHVTEALDREKKKWEEEKSAEIKLLNAEAEKTVNTAKANAANEAMERLTNVLLGLDNLPVGAPVKTGQPVQQGGKPSATAKPAAEKKAKPAPKKVEKVEEEQAEAWLESFKCTTCNECTEKFPHIFEYNEDKQAFIKEGFKGKFSELVLAAEECPAACIHPGAPQNKKEKDVDEFIKRAAKFN